ncbi:hypothetical protein MMC30_006818 [Trapelia coarctata]|nr:hypothetical protein [Trapelia coarctata]
MTYNVELTKKTFTLNTGDKIPAIGLGTWQSPRDVVAEAVKHALLVGYRHIDTALAYGNEAEIGKGIKESGVPRSEIWLTTKLDNTWHHRVMEGIDTSLKNLGTDYVDLYLMHWPSSTDPSDTSKHLPDWNFIKTWAEMEKIPKSKAHNIGVANFGKRNLKRLLNSSSCQIIPAVNQIELHPSHPSPNLVAYCKEQGIHSTGYSCLGSTNSPLYKDPTLLLIADKRMKTPQQILLAWGIHKGWSVIPKSVTKERIEKNFGLDGWELTPREVEQINNLTDRFKVCTDDWLPVKVFFDDDDDDDD